MQKQRWEQRACGESPSPLQCAQRPSLLRSRSPRLAPRPPLPGQPLGLLLLWRRLKRQQSLIPCQPPQSLLQDAPAKVYLDSARLPQHMCMSVGMCVNVPWWGGFLVASMQPE